MTKKNTKILIRIYLMINCEEDLDNLVLFFWYHQTPFWVCSCQKKCFLWRTYWTDLCSCCCCWSCCYVKLLCWIPLLPQFFLGIYEELQHDMSDNTPTLLPKTLPWRNTRNFGPFSSHIFQTTWPHNNRTHKFCDFW